MIEIINQTEDLASSASVLMLEAHLSNCWVQVVHDHQHYGGCLTSAARVLIYGVSSEETEGNSRKTRQYHLKARLYNFF